MFIYTEKARFPSRGQFRISMGSSYFTDSELKSSDYTCFLFSEDLLTGLVLSEIAYGYPLHVHQYNEDYRGYLSPNRLFMTKPSGGGGQATYWEDNPESPHIYGSAADIQVLDHNSNGSYQDDWDTLAAIMMSHGINPINMGDSTYIHAEDSSAFLSPLVSISLTPNSVTPGYGYELGTGTYLTKECSLRVHIDASLSPYTGDVLMRAEEAIFSGGHHHTGRPLNFYPAIHDVSSDSLNAWGGTINTIYRDTCKYGGQYRLIAYYQDGSRVYYSEDTLTIAAVGLAEFPEDSSWDWTGTTDAHPDNHYLDTLWTERLDLVIAEFYRRCRNDTLLTEQRRLRVNDMSLPNGGLFDIGPRPSHLNWVLWFPPHLWHRGGYEADLGYAEFDTTGAYFKYLREACISAGRRNPYREGDHLHCYLCTREERRWRP